MVLLENAPEAWDAPVKHSGTADDAVIDDWATYTRAARSPVQCLLGSVV